MDEPVAPKAAKRQWRCPYCRTRLVSRLREDDATFTERCGAHQRSRYCPALVLSKQLLANGMERLLNELTGQFLASYEVLKEAALVQQHRTRVGPTIDSTRAEPWAPGWAVAYETHLRKQRRTFTERLAELQVAAESPESIERVLAFLILVDSPAT